MIHRNNQVGIVSMGAFLPPILDALTPNQHPNNNLRATAQSLGVKNRSLKTSLDDTVSLGVNALQLALDASDLDLRSVCQSLYLGTETPTYAVGNNAAAIAHFAGIQDSLKRAATIEFACRAGSLALIQAAHEAQIYDQVHAAVGADVAHGAANDILAFTTGIGAASIVLGGSSFQKNWLASLQHITSYTSRISDFWRAPTQDFPAHAGRLSTKAYSDSIETCLGRFFAETNTSPTDFDHVIVHQPNLKLPKIIFRSFGFTEAQTNTGLIFSQTGNLYAAMVLTSLTHVLEQAEPNQNILCVSYGSGSGSDALWFKTTDNIVSHKATNSVANQIVFRNQSS
jgi:hydroxymethylglutaryl-CoA synthase